MRLLIVLIAVIVATLTAPINRGLLDDNIVCPPKFMNDIKVSVTNAKQGKLKSTQYKENVEALDSGACMFELRALAIEKRHIPNIIDVDFTNGNMLKSDIRNNTHMTVKKIMLQSKKNISDMEIMVVLDSETPETEINRQSNIESKLAFVRKTTKASDTAASDFNMTDAIAPLHLATTAVIDSNTNIVSDIDTIEASDVDAIVASDIRTTVKPEFNTTTETVIKVNVASTIDTSAASDFGTNIASVIETTAAPEFDVTVVAGIGTPIASDIDATTLAANIGTTILSDKKTTVISDFDTSVTDDIETIIVSDIETTLLPPNFNTTIALEIETAVEADIGLTTASDNGTIVPPHIGTILTLDTKTSAAPYFNTSEDIGTILTFDIKSSVATDYVTTLASKNKETVDSDIKTNDINKVGYSVTTKVSDFENLNFIIKNDAATPKNPEKLLEPIKKEEAETKVSAITSSDTTNDQDVLPQISKLDQYYGNDLDSLAKKIPKHTRGDLTLDILDIMEKEIGNDKLSFDTDFLMGNLDDFLKGIIQFLELDSNYDVSNILPEDFDDILFFDFIGNISNSNHKLVSHVNKVVLSSGVGR